MHIDRHFRFATIGDLRQHGARLEYTCGCCGRTRLFEPGRLPFGNLQPIATAHRRMRCSTCGWAGDGTVTRARTAKVAGRQLFAVRIEARTAGRA